MYFYRFSFTVHTLLVGYAVCKDIEFSFFTCNDIYVELRWAEVILQIFTREKVKKLATTTLASHEPFFHSQRV